MESIAPGLWIMRFPLRLAGTSIGRTVSIVRLRSGPLVIHSTGPFTPSDIAAIRQIGPPGWMVEATLFHDTFARDGHRAFPDVPYLAPPGFLAGSNIPTAPLDPPPAVWKDELEVIPVEGMPKVREFLLLHRPTRTLIVADLVFNFGPDTTPWTRFFFRHVSGIRRYPGVSRIFRLSIQDRAAFARSVRRVFDLDFDRLIVGHGDVIASGAKARLREALSEFVT